MSASGSPASSRARAAAHKYKFFSRFRVSAPQGEARIALNLSFGQKSWSHTYVAYQSIAHFRSGSRVRLPTTSSTRQKALRKQTESLQCRERRKCAKMYGPAVRREAER